MFFFYENHKGHLLKYHEDMRFNKQCKYEMHNKRNLFASSVYRHIF